MTFSPTHYIDITDVFDKKADALRAHVSQLGEGEEFDNGVLKWIKERFTDVGQPEDVQYAEVFKVMYLSRANEEVRDKDLEEAAAQEG
jgi:LmbE family N-acetylglucosaminyl deacetylase